MFCNFFAAAEPYTGVKTVTKHHDVIRVQRLGKVDIGSVGPLFFKGANLKGKAPVGSESFEVDNEAVKRRAIMI